MRRCAIVLALISIVMLTADIAVGQCAMCGAIAETASEDNSGIGIGLNKGIIFLMSIPYIIFSIVAWVFFRKQIQTYLKSVLKFK